MNHAWRGPQRLAVALVVLGSACAGRSTTVAPHVQPPVEAQSPELRAAIESAATGVRDPELAELLRDNWAARLRWAPTWATQLGVHDYDARLADGSAAAIDAARAARDGWLTRAEALHGKFLDPEDALTLALFTDALRTSAAAEICRSHEWNVSVQRNPINVALGLHEGFALETQQDEANLVARYRAIGTVVDDQIASLRRGAADGLYASQQTLELLLGLIDRQLAVPVDEWTVFERAAAERPAFRSELRAAIGDVVVPAFVRYRDFVRDELIPHARGPEQAGISALPNGAACYEAKILAHTTLPLRADQVHTIGVEQLQQINAEMVELGRSMLGTKTLAETVARLRDDRSLYFTDSAEVEAAAVEALAQAKEAMPRFFGVMPTVDCIVRPIPAVQAPNAYIGYYNPPNADGTKPGEYFINTFAPTTRPRFEARVLAVHESIPGHHLQVASSMEREALPAFRRYAGYSAYVEGWALYTERLAEEMGLYQTDLDRMGMLSFDAWRASRLVVDTGIHAKGWTREQAEAFMLEHTALTPGNIAVEVDRYIGWPGQALGYKIGQIEMWKLRRHAEQALGDEFVLSEFHDVVLGGGPLPLPILRENVERWVAAAAAQ